ncbi:MAG: LPS export ABC transporter periplasmic protein LptC [Bradyrhizobiaceae bacterium]|nr:MAG: LPS export ABC transporter periplasmic protein LptC [Bradyrhizobiaceae bacterium]
MSSVQGQNYQASADARYAIALRHSRRVRLLRKAVPAVVVVSLLVILLASIFNPFRFFVKLPLDMGQLSMSGTTITMDSPHLAGFTPDQRPYELWARAATQDVTKPSIVELQDMRAKIQMEDKSGLTLDARVGRFDTKSQVLTLRDDILLQSSTGYEARLTQADVDMANGTVSSDNPVAVKLLDGTLDAQNLRITENGELVRFDGGVTMILIMNKPDQTNKDDTAGTGGQPAAAQDATAPK